MHKRNEYKRFATLLKLLRTKHENECLHVLNSALGNPPTRGKGAATETATPGTDSKASLQKKPWSRRNKKPEGRAYTPFYGKSRGPSWREKESDTVRGIRLNWVYPYPQKNKDAAPSNKTDEDHYAGNSLESALSMLAAYLGFAYVWIIRGSRNPTPATDNAGAPTPEWSAGICLGNVEKKYMVHGSVYVTVVVENKQVVTGLRCGIIPGGRLLGLWVADADMPRPFAPRGRRPRKPRKKNKKAKVAEEVKNAPTAPFQKKPEEDDKAKPKVLQPSPKPENRDTKGKNKKNKKKKKKATKKEEEEEVVLKDKKVCKSCSQVIPSACT
ncbi:hypothetical protein PG993_002870 [Apiospora rasikravindrae]|uniref:Uncharacterized protein n=1 Tax=Apiospora rasikravindrae TaxID=990691 RepID=A0ABR1U043_9PEZI